MSRAFSRAAGDFIAFSPGSAASTNGGNQTVLWLWKPDTNVPHGLGIARNAGSATVWGVNPYLDLKYYYTTSGFVSADTYAVGGPWYLFGLSKAAGSSVVRTHVYDYTAATWAHTNWGSLPDSAAGPVAEIRAGWFSGTDILNGKLAAMAIFSGVLSDLAVQGLTASFTSWMALGPLWAIKLNQASVATPVTDQTGGGGNQTSISGTTVSADEPAGWSYGGTQPGRWGVHI